MNILLPTITASKPSLSAYDFTSVGTDANTLGWQRAISEAIGRVTTYLGKVGTNSTSLAGLSLPLDEAEIEFQQQRNAFLSIPDSSLEPYRNQYVISRDGAIVDSDTDIQALTERFIKAHGHDVPFYITRIGEEQEIFLDTPFLD